MKCSLLSLSSYLDDELEAGKRGELEAHLVGCQRCSNGLGHLREEVERIHGLASIQVDETATRSLMEQLGLIMEGDPLPERSSPRPSLTAAPPSLPWLNAEAGKALPWRTNRETVLETAGRAPVRPEAAWAGAAASAAPTQTEPSAPLAPALRPPEAPAPPVLFEAPASEEIAPGAHPEAAPDVATEVVAAAPAVPALAEPVELTALAPAVPAPAEPVELTAPVPEVPAPAERVEAPAQAVPATAPEAAAPDVAVTAPEAITPTLALDAATAAAATRAMASARLTVPPEPSRTPVNLTPMDSASTPMEPHREAVDAPSASPSVPRSEGREPEKVRDGSSVELVGERLTPTIELPGVSIQPRRAGLQPSVETSAAQPAAAIPASPSASSARIPEPPELAGPVLEPPQTARQPELSLPNAPSTRPISTSEVARDAVEWTPPASRPEAARAERPFEAPTPTPVDPNAWLRSEAANPAGVPAAATPWQPATLAPSRSGPLARIKERWAVQRALNRAEAEATDDAQAVEELEAGPEPRYETQAGPRVWSRAVGDAEPEWPGRSTAAEPSSRPWAGPVGTHDRAPVLTSRPVPGRHSRPLLARRAAVDERPVAAGMAGMGERINSWVHNRALMAFVGSLLLLVIIAVSVGRAGSTTRSVTPPPATLPQPDTSAAGQPGAGQPAAGQPEAPPGHGASAPPASVALHDAHTLGSGSPGAQVKEIRFGSHPGFYRIVLDIAPAGAGTPTATVGFKDPTTMWVLIDGGVPGGPVSKPDSILVTDVSQVDPPPSGKIAYQFKLAHAVSVSSQYLTSPMRLVLDLR